MAAAGPDRRDVVMARVLVGAAVVGAAWLASAFARPCAGWLWRGARFAAVTWLPAFVAGQVREAWATSAPAPAVAGATAGGRGRPVAPPARRWRRPRPPCRSRRAPELSPGEGAAPSGGECPPWGGTPPHALWRGFVGFYSSNDLTHASSIAYFALLSLFPGVMLMLALLGHLDRVRRGANGGRSLLPAVLSDAVRVPDQPTGCPARPARHAGPRRRPADGAGRPSACSVRSPRP